MINEFYNFLTSKNLRLERNKDILSNKLTYIMNDQMTRYKAQTAITPFIEFIYKNAVASNKKDMARVTEFFSRVYNTFVNLHESVFEVRTFLYAMIEERTTKNLVVDYLVIREALFKLVGVSTDIKIQTSSVKVMPLDLVGILALFKTPRADLNKFLNDNKLPSNIDFVTVDLLVHFYLSNAQRLKQALSTSATVDVKQFRRRAMLKRVRAKLITYVTIKQILKRQQSQRETNGLDDAIRQMKKTIREKTYFREETLKAFSKAFIEHNRPSQLSELRIIKEGFEDKLNEEKKSYFVLLSKKLNRKDIQIKDLANHTIQLLYLKQLADIKKLVKETEEIKVSKRFDDMEKVAFIKKDLLLYEFFRRETIDGVKNVIKEPWQEIVKNKFDKIEDFDKDIITFIKRAEISLNKEVTSRIEKRNEMINRSLNTIRNTPLMDDIAEFLNTNADHIKPTSRLPELIGNLNAPVGDNVYGSKLFNRSKILNRAPVDKSVLDHKGIHMCAKCKGLVGNEGAVDAIEKKRENGDLEDFEEKLIQNDMDANVSILNYVNKKKGRGSLLGKPASLSNKKIHIEGSNKNVLPPPPLLPINNTTLPPPMIPTHNNTLPPPSLMGNKGTGLPLPPVMTNSPGLPPIKTTGPGLPPPPIQSMSTGLPPPPMKNTLMGLPPPPIQTKTTGLPQPPMPMSNNGPSLPPPPIKTTGPGLPPPPGLKPSNQGLPPPPGLQLNTQGLPPPPMIKTNNGLPPPMISTNKTPNSQGTQNEGTTMVPPPFLPPPKTLVKTQATHIPQTTNNNNAYTNDNFNTNAVAPTAPSYPPLARSDGRKMKTLFWEKIENHQIPLTIWPEILMKTHNIPLDKILEYFEDKKVEKIATVTRTTKIMKIDLIGDDTRANVLNIAITKLLKINKLNWTEIVDMVINIDEEKVGYETFISLKKVTPLAVEIEKARTYKDDVENLDVASRWICEVKDVPRFSQRIDALVLQHEFEKEYIGLKDFIDTFYDTCEMLRENLAFQRFMRICLDAGNVLNTNSRRGDAYGFKAVSIKEFITCTSVVKTGISLLEYIMIEINLMNPKLLDFIEDLKVKSEMSAGRNIEDVVDDIIELKGRFNLLRTHLESAEQSNPPDTGFISKFEVFLADNGEKMVVLEEEGLKTKEFYFEVMILLGENERKLKTKKSKEQMSVYSSIFAKMHGLLTKIKNIRI